MFFAVVWAGRTNGGVRPVSTTLSIPSLGEFYRKVEHTLSDSTPTSPFPAELALMESRRPHQLSRWRPLSPKPDRSIIGFLAAVVEHISETLICTAYLFLTVYIPTFVIAIQCSTIVILALLDVLV